MPAPFLDFKQNISREWWLIGLQGLLGVAFGVMVWAWPIEAVGVFAVFWGLYMIIDGAANLFSGWRLYKNGLRWWPYLLLGGLSFLVGLLAVIWPGITVVALLYIVAIWAVAGGLGQLVAAVRLHQVLEGDWLLLFVGLMSIVFGLLLFLRPLAGLVAMALIIGFFAIISGFIRMLLAWRMRPRT